MLPCMKPAGRVIAARFLAPDIVSRNKHGFSIPVDHWLRGPLAAVTQEILLELPTGARQCFNQEKVRRLVEDHRSGRANYGARLWLLITFYLWHWIFLERELG
jgi:asparagine synthase (glutamine-hydrolysing)